MDVVTKFCGRSKNDDHTKVKCLVELDALKVFLGEDINCLKRLGLNLRYLFVNPCLLLIMKNVFLVLACCMASLYWGGFVVAGESVDLKPAVADPKAAEAKTKISSLSKPNPSVPGNDWQPLFDGETLKGWKVIEFVARGEVLVKPVVSAKDKATNSVARSAIFLEAGDMLTGIKWTQEVPKTNYEISLLAMKVDGSDFFCGLTFPVRDSFCTFVVGGWGGGIVGISSLDGHDASENETTQYEGFEKGCWYQIRVRVSDEMLEAWIDQKKMVDVKLKGRRIALRRGEIDKSVPLGIATYQTSAALRDIKWRRLKNSLENSSAAPMPQTPAMPPTPAQ
jgi:hypothetical protein